MHPQSSTSPLENWKPVVGYEGWYEVSDLGRVRRVRRARGTWPDRVLMPRLSHCGYLQVCLCREGENIAPYIHRLVLAAFVRPATRQEEANHVNGLKADNRLANLEWVTSSRNTRHAFTTGLAPRGEHHGNAKLTEDQVRQIRALGDQFSQRELARRFGVRLGSIQGILHRQTWKHV